MAHRRLTARNSSIALLSVAALSAGVAMLPTNAQADWRYRRHHDGGAVAAGLIGGLALGAIAGGALAASRPAYGYEALPPPPPRYRPAPVYYAPPRVVYEEQPVYCEWRRQKVWIDSYTYQVRRVRVCN